MIFNQIRQLAYLVDEEFVRDHGAVFSASSQQIVAVQILFRIFTQSRAERLEIAREVLGRKIDSFKELSYGEAHALLELGYEPIGDRLQDKVVSMELYMAVGEVKEDYREKQKLIRGVHQPSRHEWF